MSECPLIRLPLLNYFTEVTTDMAEVAVSSCDIPNALVRDQVVDAVLVFVPLPASDPFAEAAELRRACTEGFDVNHVKRYRQGNRPGGHSDAGWRCTVVEHRE